jgi:DNA-binding transcriptional LysR family regulator
MAMDPISDLRLIVLLTHHPRLARSSQELGITPSMVSKRLAALEQRLGVRLMNRSTRRLSLTAEGEAYLSEGARILEDLDVLEHGIAGSRAMPRGLLRVHATLGFGRRHIVPAVSRFIQAYPDVEVQLHLSDRPPNLIEQGFDVAIRVGEIPDSRLTMRTIAFNRRLLCAAPGYLASAGTPVQPADLTAHRCIVIRESDETYGSWHLSSDARSESVKVRGNLSTNDGGSALAWALEGHGILSRSEWELAPYLRSGSLIPVLPEWRLPPANIVALYPTRRNVPARTRAFVDDLADWYEGHRSTSRQADSPW